MGGDLDPGQAEAAQSDGGRADPVPGNVLSQPELREPLMDYAADGNGLNVEVADNISILSLRGFLTQARNRSILKTGLPPVENLSQVIAHPSYTALYDAAGTKIPQSSIYAMPANAPERVKTKVRKSLEIQVFEPATIDISCLDVCNDQVVFGGAAHRHFGHHLLDGMSRLWYYSGAPTLYLDALLRGGGDGGFMSDYTALGRPRQFFTLDRPTIFQSVTLPHAAIQNAFLIYENADTEHLAIAGSALRDVCPPRATKFYLSRRGIANRECECEEELERRLTSHGFMIVRLEELSILEQISIFTFADWIVGPTGSAFHNLLFTPRCARLKTVQLTASKPHLRFLMIDRVKGHTSYYARTMSAEMETEGKILATRVDVEQTLTVLRAIGALSESRKGGR